MKLTLAIILILNLQAVASVYSQTKVTLNLKSADFKQVISAIEKKSSFRFVFSERKIPTGIRKDIVVNDEDVVKVLDQLLEDSPYTYTELSEKLIAIVMKGQSLKAIKVTGKVLDERGQPLPGASVKVKGSTLGRSTDGEGNFSINVPDDAVLVISYIGYQDQEVVVNGRSSLSVTLVPLARSLQEVVVVGYGTQKKANLTGAVSSVESKDINWKPVGQASTALQGVATGVTVTTTSGQPGLDAGSITIRGLGTLNNRTPLVLVDGVQYNINDVDVNDIASISVLKDAAAASIYGVRAANGVILITTKRGASGRANVSYSDYFGWQSPARLARFVGAQKFMQLANVLYQNSGGGAVYTEAQINAYNDPNRDLNLYPDNYWLDMVLQGSGFQQEHSLSVGGGSEGLKYRFSTNYFDQKGLIKNMDYDRITVRLNTDLKVTDKLNFNADISGRLASRKEPQGQEGSAWYQFGQAAIITPLAVNKYTNGAWAIVRGSQNPIRLQEEGGLYEYKDNLFTGNFRADYEVIKGLKLSGIASVNYNADYNSTHNKALDYFDYKTDTLLQTIGQNSIKKEYSGYWFRNFQGLAEYQKIIEKHSFKLLGGISHLSERADDLTGTRLNLPSTLDQIDAGAAEGQSTSGNASEYTLISYFGRLNYSFNDKYLLEANIRRDGSSRFSTGQKWGWFPSFSAGWRLASEPFIKNMKAFSDLKLRASWGKLGNDDILPNDPSVDKNYPYQSNYLANSYPFGGVLSPTAGLQLYPNSGLTWETSKMTDVGLDMGLLAGKLNITFDYFDKTTSDILLQLRIPESVGLGAPYQNAAKVQNRGWEFSVNYGNKIGEFNYSIGANLSDVKNKVLDLKNSDQISIDNNNIATGLMVGSPIWSYYGYIVDGIYQTQEQVDSHAKISNAVGPGDLIYRDIDGNGVYNSKDMVNLGSAIPRYTYGINLNASFRGFDMSAFLQGVGKVDINTVVMERAPYNLDANFKSVHEDSWTPENTDASFPRLYRGQQNYQSSSFWVKSGAYLRLKSLQLGYTLPKDLLKRISVSNCRLFVSGQNLLTFSKLPDDIDPEAPNDNRYYPQVKTYTFGVNVGF